MRKRDLVSKEQALAVVDPLTEGFSEQQLAFAWWIATGKKKRKPGSMKRFAESIGRSPDRVSKWQRMKGFDVLVAGLTKASVGLRWPNIVHAIADEAEDGHVEAAKFVGRVLGRYSEGVQVSGDPQKPVTFRFIFPAGAAPIEEPLLGEVVEGEVVSSDADEG